MEAQKLEAMPPPPGVISSLKAGFDVVSTHIVAILLPVALDLLLWLGPRLSLEKLVGPAVADMIQLIRVSPVPGQDAQVIIEFYKRVGEQFSRYNLFDVLRTFPIGIFSLMVDKLPAENPFGPQSVMQVSSIFSWFGWLVLLTLLGWVGGGLYFRWVSGAALGGEEAGISPLRAVTQTILLSVLWIIAALIIFVPVSLVFTLLYLISPLLVQGGLLLLGIFSVWLIVPLFFTPHGIFVRKQNAFTSIYFSLRMARFTLPTSSLFILGVFLLSQGLNYLWKVPPADSWMMLVGIIGHAFITTALLAASFVYYRDMNVWLQIMLEKLQQQAKSPTGRI